MTLFSDGETDSRKNSNVRFRDARQAHRELREKKQPKVRGYIVRVVKEEGASVFKELKVEVIDNRSKNCESQPCAAEEEFPLTLKDDNKAVLRIRSR
jgi:hypothetical protein